MKKNPSFLTPNRIKRWATLCLTLLMLLLMTIKWTARAQILTTEAPQPLSALSSSSAPLPDLYGSYVMDKNAAIALGKSLFWDVQTGSDGVQACASCHFHAGADNRSKNQLNPGCKDCPGGPDGFSFGSPNYQLQANDFPFHQVADPNNRYSAVTRDRNEVASSQGIFNSSFLDIALGSDKDSVKRSYDNTYHVGNNNTRRVEPRNTPTIINVIFNHRNFWDGRAHNEFNGVNPFGDSDPNARIMVSGGALKKVSLRNASLASLSTGPIVSDFEMSAAGRVIREVGRKVLSLPTPLAKQAVASDDSVLAPYRNGTGKGLNTTYKALVQKAFFPNLWNDTVNRATIAANETSAVSPSGQYSQMEYNFGLYWGLAINLYLATLVSDQTPMDKYLRGNADALTSQQLLGKQIFEGKGKCASCHGGAETTDAAVSHAGKEKTEFMAMAQGKAVYDAGFYNTGVRPTSEDLGVGGVDPYGKPFSFSRSSSYSRVAVDGAFKTPQLRNVELTAPYFHDGGKLTLEQVVQFYNRGGDFHDQNIQNLDPDIENLGLTQAEQDALVSFLKAMTDERVRYHAAPFDHPEIKVPNGHPGNTAYVDGDGNGQALDAYLTIPAIGKYGTGHPTTQTFSEIRYKAVTSWSVTGYLLFLPIYGWVTKQVPYTYTYTREVWVGTPPTKPFLQ